MSHLQEGAHIKALHDHRQNECFCRVDITHFFYTVQRNRVKRALKQIGVAFPEHYAKWSTVKNPYQGGGYVLPYGFIQSPILATLVLSLSPVAEFLRQLDPTITRSVYMDDISLSGPDVDTLSAAYEGLRKSLVASGFNLNENKSRPPANQIDIFNCDLAKNRSEVKQDRITEFYAGERSDQSIAAFEQYCDIVKSANWRAKPEKA
ncbi:hypothetical protein BJF95_10400 [Rhizobium oryziradicis]|uniref:Reverse transcriptase domain-containing protein n=2 Tax=Rhizobium oryziradicis TaxID=1867956 RepID=A0A1Q8ZUM1_9HYPH|nr:hypothetical protein BJF95_10400 [Rhizobium oryziradicis]